MQVVRLYTGDDGQSHFEELDLGYEQVADAQRSAMQSAVPNLRQSSFLR
ncbi:MAG: hypothetical protein IIA64_12795 [Planctomycetes bacterium]|nr:hypothetical protein [Planctomycetota bacterium]